MGRQVDAKVIIRWLGRYYQGCCPSCHEDDANGLPMVYIDLGKGRWAEVCCQVAQAVQEKINQKGEIERKVNLI